MKYYFKSPEELQNTAQQKNQELSGKRNRGNLVIFADLFVICLIFAGIYYSGALRPDRYVSETLTSHASFELSGSVELPANTADALVFYLNIKHTGPEPTNFPGSSEQLSGTQNIIATIEILADRNHSATDPTAPVRFSAAYPLANRVIRPGETTIYRTELRVPNGTANFQKGDARIRFQFGDDVVIVVL